MKKELREYHTAIIYDDIIDSGKTIFATIEQLLKHEIRRYKVLATHDLSREIVWPEYVEDVIVTDSVIKNQGLYRKIFITQKIIDQINLV